MSKKKIIFSTLAAFVVVGVAYFSFAPKHDKNADKIITVATSPGPYSEMFLDGVKPILEKEGYQVRSKNFSVLLNADIALNNGEADLNVDQHTAYLDNFNKEKHGHLTGIVKIPTVPMGLYTGEKHNLNDVAAGDTIAIPNDPSNMSRAYRLLAQAGLIKLKSGVNEIKLTQKDIAENPNGLKFKEMESYTIPRVRNEFAYVVLPGSDFYPAKVPSSDILYQEKLADAYYLVATVNQKDKNKAWAKAVKKAYQSKDFAEFVQKHNDTKYWVVPKQ